MAKDDPLEAAVLERARRNFRDKGPGDRMWSDPSPTQGMTMSAGFTLSDDQRAAYIAAARAEIASEGDTAERPGKPPPAGDDPRPRLGILALYESSQKAQAAQATLVAAGVPERTIRLVAAPADPDEGRLEAGGSPTDDHPGFRDRLGRIGVPSETLDTTCAQMRQGAAILSLVVTEAQRDRVMGILKDQGSVDPTLRHATWDAEGWGGTSPVSTEGWGGYSATSTSATDITTRQE
jgi:hypothetical protein